MSVIRDNIVKSIYWAKKIHECSSEGMTDEEIAKQLGIGLLKVIRREKEIYGYLFLGKEKPEQGLSNLRLPKVKLEERERE